MRAPEHIVTDRLRLRRPDVDDAEEVFRRYASDIRVCRYVGWPLHRHVDATRAFLSWADQEWARWPAGAFLMESRETGRLLGSTGLSFETEYRAATGYVLAADAWGRGFATEALRAMIDLSAVLRVRRLYAVCHVEHAASAHVLEKCGFTFEGILRRYAEFPNLPTPDICDVRCYSRVNAAG